MDDIIVQMREKLKTFSEMMDNIGYANEIKTNDLDDYESILKAIDEMIMISSRLGRVFAKSPDSIYLADKDGKTIMVNEAFEKTTGVGAEEVVGKNVADLEAQGFFRPSVIRLMKEENRPISILQIGRNKKKIIVTGVPILNASGEIEMMLSNACLAEKIENLYSYVDIKREYTRDSNKAKVTMKSLFLESDSMKKIYTLVDQVKDTDSTILITGESGVGKGVLARTIHEISIRAEKPMIEINCGAIPETLIESELFGYASGAFTGASIEGKEGLLELADKGTLLLDEIGDLPLALQVKLLKIIQDKEVTRIGGKKAKKIDIRIIAATNQPLPSLIKKGRFRADLYYRLNVIPIEIPPLQERPEDIETAAVYFADVFSKKYNKKIHYTVEFIENLKNFDWPGNLRELENYIERAVLTSENGLLMDKTQINPQIAGEETPFHPNDSETKYSFITKSMKNAERELIIQLYDKYRSSYKVAKELEISQTKAYRLIKKHCNNV